MERRTPECLDTLPSPGERTAHTDSGERRCLEVDELLAFVQGGLNGSELKEAHEHLDGCGMCQRLLNEAAHALTTIPVDPPDDSDWNTMFLPNAIVGQRYRIERFIARGGMGEVYEAYDCELQERVALKTVASTACDSPRAVRRLKAEVQLAHRVSHRNVCRIYDLGAHVLESSGALISFLTMEFVEGDSLGERIRSHGALPLELAQAIARQLLLGLSAAHGAGIMHRDFKSDNVMLRTEPDGSPTPVILDFGLARSLNADAMHHTSGRNIGLVGTLSYMAPEQVEGKPLSAASDLYAFAVVWFEMLTGRLPFGADSAAGSALERLRKPAVAPSSINPAVPRALDAIVLRCLSRSAADRFSTADEVLEALDGLASVPTAGLKRRRSARVAVAIGTVALLGGLATLVSRPTAPTREVSPAPSQLEPLRPPKAALPPPKADDAGATPETPSPGPHPLALTASRQPGGDRPASTKPARNMAVAEAAPAQSKGFWPQLPSELPQGTARMVQPSSSPSSKAFSLVPSPAERPPPSSGVDEWENPFRKRPASER